MTLRGTNYQKRGERERKVANLGEKKKKLKIASFITKKLSGFHFSGGEAVYKQKSYVELRSRSFIIFVFKAKSMRSFKVGILCKLKLTLTLN